MTDPLTILILVASGELTDATTRGMATAARDALGPAAHVVVSETHAEPDDAQAIAREKSEHADAVVELRWAPHHRHATVRMHIVRTGRWIDRQMTFRPSDADAERGRTLGLAIASILPDAPSAAPPDESGPPPAIGVGEEARPPESTSPEAPAAPAPASTGPAPSPAPSSSASFSSPSSPSGAPAGPPPSATAAPTPTGGARSGPPPERGAGSADDSSGGNASSSSESSNESGFDSPFGRTALDLFLVGASGIDGGGRGLGGAGALHWFVTPWMSFRVGVGVRGGTIDDAQGNLLMVFGGAGVALHPWPVRPGRRLGVSLRADYLLVYEKLTHFALSNDQNQDVQDGVLSGADAVVDGEWLFSSNVEAIVGVGLEAFAPTFIDINGARVASLPLLRAVGEAGLRLHF